MQAFGYQKNKGELIELREVSFKVTTMELEKIINFLQETKQLHGNIVDETHICHSHFRDWDATWQIGTVDIIVATGDTEK